MSDRGNLRRLALVLGGAVGCGDGGMTTLGSSGPDTTTSEGASTASESTATSEPTTGDTSGGLRVVAGAHCTCILWDEGALRCWGANGCTGWGDTLLENVGDDETPASIGDVPADFDARDFDLGDHSCAVTVEGAVRCWGNDDAGQLGLGEVVPPASGAQESIAAVLGAEAVAVSIGERHTCAVTEDAMIRCWGLNSHGQLGYGHTLNIGDDETPASAGDVSVGRPAVQVVAGGAGLGGAHTCALLDDGSVRCWGWTLADFGEKGGGILGYGNNENIGDDELPSAVGPVDLGGPVARLAAGGRHTCALRVDGALVCWGLNRYGALGLGHTEDIGDDETPNPAGIVPLGSAAVAVAAAWYNTCAILENGEVRCWGSGAGGTHGYGNTMDLGDDELPAALGPLDFASDTPAVQLTGGRAHICALFADAALRCWGYNSYGQLGLGSTVNIGDDESPAAAGAVPYE